MVTEEMIRAAEFAHDQARGPDGTGFERCAVRAMIEAALAAQPAATDDELERLTGEPHIDGWPLYSGLPSPTAARGETQ